MSKKSKIGYIRKLQHLKYVESQVVQRRANVIKMALLFGKINSLDRELFMKYNDYLQRLKNP